MDLKTLIEAYTTRVQALKAQKLDVLGQLEALEKDIAQAVAVLGGLMAAEQVVATKDKDVAQPPEKEAAAPG